MNDDENKDRQLHFDPEYYDKIYIYANKQCIGEAKFRKDDLLEILLC